MIFKSIKHRIKLLINEVKILNKFDVLIEKGVTMKYVDSIVFGKKCTLQSGVYVYGSRTEKSVTFGNNVVIGMNGVILGEGGVHIGDGTHFGPNVVLTTQYGDRNNIDPSQEQTILKYKSVKLGKGAWIGAGSIIMPGTILGDNCGVAPNSVVYGIWKDNVYLSGNPARRRKF